MVQLQFPFYTCTCIDVKTVLLLPNSNHKILFGKCWGTRFGTQHGMLTHFDSTKFIIVDFIIFVVSYEGLNTRLTKND